MSVTEYLTDHTGRKIAFFYYIDSERYSAVPKLVWKCRQHPEYSGTCASKAEFIECAKAVLKELKKVPVCKDCGLTSDKLESQDACPDCLGDPYSYK